MDGIASAITAAASDSPGDSSRRARKYTGTAARDISSELMNFANSYAPGTARRRPRRGGRETAVGRGLAHLAQHRRAHRLAADGLLERGEVEVGDAPQVVPLRERARGRAHRLRVFGRALERVHERVDLA